MKNSIYLASRSPRRHEILRQIGLPHEVLLTRIKAPRGEDVKEIQAPGEDPRLFVERLAQEKAIFAEQAIKRRGLVLKPILAADTVVILDNQVLGKPSSKDQAKEYLQSLSNRSHEVYTAIAINQAGHIYKKSSSSTVRFKELTDQEIQRYVNLGDGLDKAGAYGIQGMASIFISHIEGSYSGIMGLPIFETVQLLEEVGITVL